MIPIGWNKGWDVCSDPQPRWVKPVVVDSLRNKILAEAARECDHIAEIFGGILVGGNVGVAVARQCANAIRALQK